MDYDERCSYSDVALAEKVRIVSEFLHRREPSQVWDLGANSGRYSVIAEDAGHKVLALDADPGAVERIYQSIRTRSSGSILPLIVDLTSPSASVGWANNERHSLEARANADVLLCLALIHHLTIGKNVPFALVSEWLARLGPTLVIEFVPPEDPMASRLIATRENEVHGYDRDGFIAAFSGLWRIAAELPIEDSLRRIFVMERL